MRGRDSPRSCVCFTPCCKIDGQGQTVLGAGWAPVPALLTAPVPSSRLYLFPHPSSPSSASEVLARLFQRDFPRKQNVMQSLLFSPSAHLSGPCLPRDSKKLWADFNRMWQEALRSSVIMFCRSSDQRTKADAIWSPQHGQEPVPDMLWDAEETKLGRAP